MLSSTSLNDHNYVLQYISYYTDTFLHVRRITKFYQTHPTSIGHTCSNKVIESITYWLQKGFNINLVVSSFVNDIWWGDNFALILEITRRTSALLVWGNLAWREEIPHTVFSKNCQYITHKVIIFFYRYNKNIWSFCYQPYQMEKSNMINFTRLNGI